MIECLLTTADGIEFRCRRDGCGRIFRSRRVMLPTEIHLICEADGGEQSPGPPQQRSSDEIARIWKICLACEHFESDPTGMWGDCGLIPGCPIARREAFRLRRADADRGCPDVVDRWAAATYDIAENK